MKINNDVADVLANSRIEGDKLFLEGSQLERNLYLAVDKVLKALGGKWARKEKAHIFESGIEDTIEAILLTGEYTDEKKEFQFFQTPIALAEELVSLAKIGPGETCLEPSAGLARIAGLMPNPDCVELNQKNREWLKSHCYNVVGNDFLEFDKRYDVIVANPPFAKQQDIKHVVNMLDLANRCVISIMSASVLYRTNKIAVEFRDRVESLGGTFMSLPDGSFKESGTNVSACILTVNL